MIIGDVNRLAIESEILFAVPSVSQLAVGFFVVHVAGVEFGVREPDATCLGCSVEQVESRLAMRGTYVNEHLSGVPGDALAAAYLSIFYGGWDGNSTTLTKQDFLEADVTWCPDGDEAFDDGSHILHLDKKDEVQILAFRNDDNARVADLVTQIIPADEFYSILETWLVAFRRERDIALQAN
ncbi:immunity 42 family protein [Pararhizobium sp. BT-229]|uniref:immunity 42 family protein n=1 Tax=Pararhizobium sp. BT-229 TaxID=2986923 RepID=UPI0021F7B5CE|nr:immunity 42 family protein [Pararhizobium sp. BT-229]MCV9961080.1 immunity 42 family protein [Pararhizobium sp. BT-229]